MQSSRYSFSIKKITLSSIAFTMVLGMVLSSIKPVHAQSNPASVSSVEKNEQKFNVSRSVVFPATIKEVFPDPNFAEFMKDYLVYPSVDSIVTEAELALVNKGIIANSKGIVNIEGIQYLKAVKVVRMIDNKITDISVLAGMPQLTTLDLSNNQISDITVFQTLTQAVTLKVASNNISTLPDLSMLHTNLNYLELSNNQITDISNLSGLTSLVFLFLKNNQIENISVLGSMTKLAHMYFENNLVSDLSPLAPIEKGIRTMSFTNNKVSDISILKNMPDLTTLRLSNNHIYNLSPIKNLMWLSVLELENQTIVLKPLRVSPTFEAQSILVNTDGTTIPASTSAGVISGNNITWSGLTNATTAVDYSFTKALTQGKVQATFSGTVVQTFQDVFATPSLPMLTVPAYTELSVGTAFDAMTGVSAIDLEEGDITSKVVVSGTVDTTTAGIYVLTYNIQDTDLNTATATHTVLVNDGTFERSNNYIISAKNFVISKAQVTSTDEQLKAMANVKVFDIAAGVWMENAVVRVDRSKLSAETGIYEVTFKYNPHITVKVTVIDDVAATRLPSTGANDSLMTLSLVGMVMGVILLTAKRKAKTV